MLESAVVHTAYNYWLVALSVLIAILASYTALDLATRVSSRQGKGRWSWILGGAVAMGSGVWSMHYTGMLAYRLPLPVYYHIPTVALSLVAAIGASFVALFVVSREKVGVFHIGIGSVLMAGGIAAMHYTGMAAMRLSAMHQWDSQLVAASIVVAWLVSLAGLVLMKVNIVMGARNRLPARPGEEGSERLLKIVCAITMGVAIPAMHYTAMAAVTYTSMQEAPDLSYAVEVSALANAAIIVITLVVLGSVFLLRFHRSLLEAAPLHRPASALWTPEK